MSLYGGSDLEYRPLELRDLLDENDNLKPELENGQTILYEGRLLSHEHELIFLVWPPAEYKRIEYPSNIQPGPNPCTYSFEFTRRDGGTIPVCFFEDRILHGQDVGKWHITIPKIPIPERVRRVRRGRRGSRLRSRSHGQLRSRSHGQLRSRSHGQLRSHRHERGPATTGGRRRKNKKSRKNSKRRH